MASTTTTLNHADVARIEAAYEFVNREEVLDFLDQHAFLVPILIEARQVIPRYFTLDLPLALELLIGPEDPDDRSLFVLIRTRLKSPDALTCLDRLDEEWWIEQSHQTDGALTITLEHR
ncbi:MAG: hypothetical protein ACRDJH_27025 [Thermomicrobiales bacterium]